MSNGNAKKFRKCKKCCKRKILRKQEKKTVNAKNALNPQKILNAKNALNPKKLLNGKKSVNAKNAVNAKNYVSVISLLQLIFSVKHLF